MSDLGDWYAAWQREACTPEHVAAWVARTYPLVEEAVPELDGDLEPLVREAVAEHWLAFLDQVAHGTPFALVPSARRLALEIAQRHLGLLVLVKAYRAAQRASWGYVTELVRDAPDDVDHEVLIVDLWSTTAAWYDASVEESIALHQRETRRIEQRGDAQRFAVVEALLAGERHDARAASADLGGYAVGGSHVALIARALTPDAVATLDTVLSRLVTGTGLGRPLIVRPGGPEVWCWASGRELPAAWGRAPDPSSVRVTVGGPADGIDGFVLAHHDARAAQSVALEPGRGQALTAYADVAALTLLAHDHDAARRFVLTTLRGLAEPDADRLRETVRAVLTSPGGTEAVATALSVHKNTVRYRVGQAERLLGRPVRERAGDLLLAMDYYDAFLDGR